MDLITISIIIAGFLAIGIIISKKLDKLSVNSDTKAFSDIASRITSVGTELRTRMDETQKRQKQIDDQRNDLAKQSMDSLQTQMGHLNRIFAGTKERGQIGENLLKEVLNPFIKNGRVIKDLNIDGKVVEFGWKVNSRKYIPIDSKLPDLIGLYKEYSETESQDKQKELKKRMYDKIKKQIGNAIKYRSKHNTTDKVILTIPDAIYEIIPEINSETNKTNILVCGYHMVVYAAAFIEREYQLIMQSGDLGEYKESIESILRIINEIKEKTETIDRGVTMIKNANDEIKDKSSNAERQRPKEKILIKEE
jgi:DNA recombination protein RmuC